MLFHANFKTFSIAVLAALWISVPSHTWWVAGFSCVQNVNSSNTCWKNIDLPPSRTISVVLDLPETGNDLNLVRIDWMSDTSDSPGLNFFFKWGQPPVPHVHHYDWLQPALGSVGSYRIPKDPVDYRDLYHCEGPYCSRKTPRLRHELLFVQISNRDPATTSFASYRVSLGWEKAATAIDIHQRQILKSLHEDCCKVSESCRWKVATEPSKETPPGVRPDHPELEFSGVYSNRDGEVEEIHLANAGLQCSSATLRTHLLGLKALRVVNLADNSLWGELDFLSGLNQTRQLYLQKNRFSGRLPCLPEPLERLDISRNRFKSIEFPPCWGSHSHVRYLSFGFNNQKKVAFRHWPLLEILLAPSCNLYWSNASFDFAPQLSRVDLRFNHLTGPLPAAYSTSAKLWYLDLQYNFLSGTLLPNPSQSLIFISLEGNRLSGTLEGTRTGWTTGAIVNLQNNQLFGDFPKLLRTNLRANGNFFNCDDHVPLSHCIPFKFSVVVQRVSDGQVHLLMTPNVPMSPFFMCRWSSRNFERLWMLTETHGICVAPPETKVWLEHAGRQLTDTNFSYAVDVSPAPAPCDSAAESYSFLWTLLGVLLGVLLGLTITVVRSLFPRGVFHRLRVEAQRERSDVEEDPEKAILVERPRQTTTPALSDDVVELHNDTTV